jgi:hypothetical protein
MLTDKKPHPRGRILFYQTPPMAEMLMPAWCTLKPH